MNSFYLAFTVVFPLFLMMALGYFLKTIKMLNEDLAEKINTLSFKVFLPTLLFINVYKSNFEKAFSLKLVVYGIASVTVMFVVLMIIVPIFEKNNLRRGVMVQGLMRSNFILFGLPVASSLFNQEGAAVTAVLIAFVVPLFNIYSVVALETYRGEGKKNYKRIFKGVFTNPLIIGAIVAFIFIILKIKLPIFIEQAVSDISKVATPLALITLGASFKFSKVGANIKPIIISTIGRLVVVPAVFIMAAVALGFTGASLGAIMVMLASPAAVSSFTMAQQMGADDELAGQMVVVGSIACVFTMFLWISGLNLIGLI